MAKATPQDVTSWVTSETPEHLKLLSRLRVRLVDSMHGDINESGTPTRDWCRAYQRYQTGFANVVAEQREHVRLRLLLDKSGQQVLSDEEYERELKQLALEGIAEVPVEELNRELERRGQQAMQQLEDEEDD